MCWWDFPQSFSCSWFSYKFLPESSKESKVTVQIKSRGTIIFVISFHHHHWCINLGSSTQLTVCRSFRRLCLSGLEHVHPPQCCRLSKFQVLVQRKISVFLNLKPSSQCKPFFVWPPTYINLHWPVSTFSGLSQIWMQVSARYRLVPKWGELKPVSLN